MRYLLFIVAFITLSDRVHAQILVTTAELDIPGYVNALNNIVKNQIVGYRTSVEYKRWDISRPNETKPAEIGRRIGIHGESMWISRNESSNFDGDNKENFSYVLEPDDFYCIKIKAAGSKNSLSSHATEWSDQRKYNNVILQFAANVQLFQPDDVKAVLEVADDEFGGRRSIRVVVQTRYGAKITAHLDRKTYQFLSSESDKMLDLIKRSFVDGKTVLTTEYREEGGKLWPTRHETREISPNGKSRPLSELNFLEYAPYVPTADELDIEKQFGIKPIPHEPRPDSAKPKPPASRTRIWLYAVAGVLAATAIGIVAIRRRKKAVTPAE